MTPDENERAQAPSNTQTAVSQAENTKPAANTNDTDDEEPDILGGMFSAIPDQTDSNQSESATGLSENVTLRDFGKSSGLTPRRLLEETVRSRLVSRVYLQHHAHMF